MKGKNFFSQERILEFKGRAHLEWPLHPGKQKESHSNVFLHKNEEKYGGVPIPLNPIILRKAKIVYNFGLSEYSRVKLFSQSSKVMYIWYGIPLDYMLKGC